MRRGPRDPAARLAGGPTNRGRPGLPGWVGRRNGVHGAAAWHSFSAFPGEWPCQWHRMPPCRRPLSGDHKILGPAGGAGIVESSSPFFSPQPSTLPRNDALRPRTTLATADPAIGSDDSPRSQRRGDPTPLSRCDGAARQSNRRTAARQPQLGFPGLSGADRPHRATRGDRRRRGGPEEDDSLPGVADDSPSKVQSDEGFAAATSRRVDPPRPELA